MNFPCLFEIGPDGKATGTVMPLCSQECLEAAHTKRPNWRRGTSSNADFGFETHCEQCGHTINPTQGPSMDNLQPQPAAQPCGAACLAPGNEASAAPVHTDLERLRKELHNYRSPEGCGKIWQIADSLDEAINWQRSYLTAGALSVRIEPHGDKSGRCDVIIMLYRHQARIILGYEVEDHEWMEEPKL